MTNKMLNIFLIFLFLLTFGVFLQAQENYLKNTIGIGLNSMGNTTKFDDVGKADANNYFTNSQINESSYLGVNLIYLRSISERFRVGLEFQQNINSKSLETHGTLLGDKYTSQLKTSPSQTLSFQTEYDFYKKNKFSMFVNGGLGLNFNKFEVKTTKTKGNIANTSGRAVTPVSFSFSGTPLVFAGSGFDALKEYCIAQAPGKGYSDYKHISTSNTGAVQISGGNVQIGNAGTTGTLTCNGTSGTSDVDNNSVYDTKTSSELQAVLAWNLGLGASYAFTEALGIVAKINYVNLNFATYNTNLNGISNKVSYDNGYIGLNLALTYKL